MLRSFILAFDDDARRQVSQPHGRIRFIDVLTARARGAIRVDTQVGRIDLNGFNFIGFGQYSDCACRRVNTPLRLGSRYALHPMGARFEFQARVDPVTSHAADNFLESAVVTLAFIEYFDAPLPGLGIFGVHAKQVTREYRCLVAARSGAHLEEHVSVIVRIGWNQQFLQFEFQCVPRNRQRLQLLLAHFLYIFIDVGGHFLGGSNVRPQRLKIAKQPDDWSNVRVLL